MGNLSDPAYLSAVAGVLLAVAQLVRLAVAIARREPVDPPEAADTPPQTNPERPAAAPAV